MSAPEAQSSRRLFVALQPPQSALQAWRNWWRRQPHPLHGKESPWRQWHLTLAFMAAVPSKRLEGAAQSIAGLTPPPLGLTGWGHFSGQGVLWFWRVNDEQVVGAVGDEVRRRLTAAKIAFDPRPLKPHITLWRRAEPGFQPVEPPPSQVFSEWSLTLVASTLTSAGASHRVLARSDGLPVIPR